MLNDHRFWGQLSGPSSSSVDALIVPSIAGTAMPQRLPRERFSRVLGMLSSLEVKSSTNLMEVKGYDNARAVAGGEV